MMFPWDQKEKREKQNGKNWVPQGWDLLAAYRETGGDEMRISLTLHPHEAVSTIPCSSPVTVSVVLLHRCWEKDRTQPKGEDTKICQPMQNNEENCSREWQTDKQARGRDRQTWLLRKSRSSDPASTIVMQRPALFLPVLPILWIIRVEDTWSASKLMHKSTCERRTTGREKMREILDFIDSFW